MHDNLHWLDVPDSVVNKDLSFKAKDLTSEHVQGPLSIIG